MILVSLFLQVFLFVFAGWRRHSTCAVVRVVLWLAYLSADTLAVFVLGHLAVRAGEPDQQLVSTWAPFLLVHLGGQDTITAFSMQDNELWLRHLLNLATQVVVAGYVVGKASWPDRRLKTSMLLVFISGFFKYAERTAHLSSARSTTRTSMLSLKLYWQGKGSYGTMRTEARQLMEETLDRMLQGSSSASCLPALMEAFSLRTDIMAGDTPLNKVPTIILADEGKLPDMLREFRSRADRYRALEHVGELLVYCYRRLYTKSYVRDLVRAIVVSRCYRQRKSYTGRNAPHLPIGHAPLWSIVKIWIVQTIFYVLPIPIALALFVAAEKGSSNSTGGRAADITVSYILLVGALVLDVLSLANFKFSAGTRLRPAWSQKLGQYNMITSRKYKYLESLYIECGCDVVHTPMNSTKEFILDSLLASGARKEWSIASTCGQLSLHKWTALTTLKESVRSDVDFPTRVLMWHIATDLCFHSTTEETCDDGVLEKRKQISRELSNYIMYLVFKCNVMLTPTSQVLHDEVRSMIGPGLYRRLHHRGEKDIDVMELFSQEINKKMEQEGSKVEVQEPEEPQDEVQIEHEEDEIIIQTDVQESANIIQNDALAAEPTNKLHPSSQVRYSPKLLLSSAIDVAKELISINNEAERWELIAAVWAEMIYYTAPRCGAAFHCDHLCTGGEFITHVLLLMYFLGPFMPQLAGA
uniref:DUF4220 domain-containing protein n=1 Tax=Oryza brachyantha TaxID=4533 RepID=J3NA84_ORYBR